MRILGGFAFSAHTNRGEREGCTILYTSPSYIKALATALFGAIFLFGAAQAQNAEVWVDFAYPALERGSQGQPFDSLAEALATVDAGGTVHISPGSSHETLTIDQGVTIMADSGPVFLGDLSSGNGSGTPYEVLKITEIMYNPGDGGAEFLELQNTGFQSLDLSGVFFSDGITYTFPPNSIVAAGGYVVLVRNTDQNAFINMYPGVSMDGAYSGALSNSGETISISDPDGNVFLSLTYNDNFPWPAGADGQGFSLIILNPQDFSSGSSNWAASGELGGAPGESDVAPESAVVLINEVLTHTDLPLVDTVEFYNPSSSTVDIRGWFLTDDKSIPQKAKIPDLPIFESIGPGEYVLITESDFFGDPGTLGGQPLPGFRLSSHGEDIYLYSANALGNLTGYAHGFSFEGAENGVSFGRHISSDGREHLVAQTSRSLGSANAGPAVGPVVISEIHYNTLPNGVEYIELTNLSSSSVKLWDHSAGGDPNNTFRVKGIGFKFDTNTTISGNAKILIVDADPAAYIAQFGDPDFAVVGPFGNDPDFASEDSLSNAGETIRVQWPDTPDEVSPGIIEAAYIDMDPVRFNDKAPWPDADGNGASLTRINGASFGGEPTNWQALTPSYQPGQGVAALAVSVPRGFYDTAKFVVLSTATPGATIRYTTDGSVPTASSGSVYSSPIGVFANKVIRASGFKDDYLNSPVETYSYMINASLAEKSIPAISIVGDPGGSLYEPDGVMAIVGGVYVPEDDWYTVWKKVNGSDYNNPLGHGIEFERPVSIEVINPWDNSGIQKNTGIRVQGSSWHRPRYFRDDTPGAWMGCTVDNLNYAKFSFRLLFRADYGPKNLNYPLFPFSPVTKHDQVVLRGGHNDTCDPFVRDELARRLHQDMGYVASTGAVTHLYLNGELKGFYNPVERLDEKFMQTHHVSTEAWDVLTHRSQVREGDDVAWWAMLNYALVEDLSIQSKYDEFATMLDIDAFIDYLILELFVNNADWPDVNWTVARERSPYGIWRFYVWDCEFAFRPDYLNSVGFREYPQRRGTGLYGEDSELPWIFQALVANPAFSQRFSERLSLHLFGAGALALTNVTARYTELQSELGLVLPAMSTFILDDFLPVRYDILLNAAAAEGLYTP